MRKQPLKQYILVGSALFNWSETQRMVEISDELYQRGYEIVFIGQGKYDYLLNGKPYIREILPYDSVWYTPERISMMLGMDRYGINYATLDEIKNMVLQERGLIDKYKPAAILTGYRTSLTISAKLCKIPIVWCLSAALSKIYLTNIAQTAEQVQKLKRNTTLSYQDIRRLFEDKIACSRLLGPCKAHTAWNTFLANNGLPPLSCDLDIYTGDLNLMSDAAELFKNLPQTDRYKFIGPILNNQYIPMPAFVPQILKKNPERKKVLISIGSTGTRESLLKILDSTLSFDCDFFVSVIGVLTEKDLVKYPENYYFCEKFPLIDICQKCDAAMIHGGQGTVYATIAGQCPFISLPSTFEQRKNIENILNHYKCGEIIRPYEMNAQSIKKALQNLLEVPDYQNQINKLHEHLCKYFTNTRLSVISAADYIEKLINQVA